nr:hypothetical protein [Heyndrickxia coagulans]
MLVPFQSFDGAHGLLSRNIEMAGVHSFSILKKCDTDFHSFTGAAFIRRGGNLIARFFKYARVFGQLPAAMMDLLHFPARTRDPFPSQRQV